MDPITIGLCGQVSTGKSSLINAICMTPMIVSTALMRETFTPERICLRVSGNNDYQKLQQITIESKKQNEKYQTQNLIPEFTEIKNKNQDSPFISYLGRDLDIIDFPGINDASDKDGKFFNILEQNLQLCDILMFITQAETAFIHASEIEEFMKIKELVDKLNNNGKYLELLIVVNKFDNPEDQELVNIFNRIQFRENLYSVSSHKLLIWNMKQNKIIQKIPREHLHEFNKILKNANVNLDPELCLKIRNGLEINFGNINFSRTLYQEIIDLNFNESGDWQNLLDKLKTIDLIPLKTKSKMNYLDSLLSKETPSTLDILKIIELIDFLEKTNLIYPIIKNIYLKFIHNPNAPFYSVIDRCNESPELIHKLVQDKVIQFDPKIKIDILLYLKYIHIQENKTHIKFLREFQFWDENYNITYYDYLKNDYVSMKNVYKPEQELNWFIAYIKFNITGLGKILELSRKKYSDLVKLQVSGYKFPELKTFDQNLFESLMIRLHDPLMFNLNIPKKNSLIDTILYYHIFININ